MTLGEGLKMQNNSIDTFHNDWVKQLDYEEIRKLRRQFWTFVLWPDSDCYKMIEQMDVDFRFYVKYALNEACIPSLIGPYHDKDVKEDGTPAKNHVHVILFFEKPQRYGVVLEMLQTCCGFDVAYLQPVANIRSMQRYLCHLDSPWKAQYSIEDVICVCGAEYVIDSETASEQVINCILDNNIVTFTMLLGKFAQSPSCRKWIVSNPSIVDKMLKEQRELRRIYTCSHINGTGKDELTEHILSDYLSNDF